MDADNQLTESIGKRIRAIRKGRGLSLLEVEELSAGEFKASVLGAYERGERSISVARLIRLATVLGEHPAALLPRLEDGPVVDLSAVERLDAERADVLDGFLGAIQRMRQDPEATSLAVRRSDLEVLSALLGEQLGELSELGD